MLLHYSVVPCSSYRSVRWVSFSFRERYLVLVLAFERGCSIREEWGMLVV